MSELPLLDPAGVEVVLCDIEGTTTPVSFVYEGLFPFARAGAGAFLATHFAAGEVQADLVLLEDEHARDLEQGHEPPEWGDTPAAVTAYVHWLMDQDRKSTGLKGLQGKIWQDGYAAGALLGQVYQDVEPAFDRWVRRGKRVAIYSSGSVLAQRLLFGHSEDGDLTIHIDAYFDTANAGPKQEAPSYAKIAAALGVAPQAILFLSDVVAELEAARLAGCQTGLSLRPGNAEQPERDHPSFQSFGEVVND